MLAASANRESDGRVEPGHDDRAMGPKNQPTAPFSAFGNQLTS